ncbi:hypothetical protein BST63_02295 [Bradyrhizobium canariense]|uniref:Uncharacterized protein n=1 Tax=Bradyrhizobium canariense TaxID=255045 RepID=A0ABX3XAN8_9BRAD|nr:hypothetical protein BSR47_04435 [Bradyrhizobium canariense]OSJ35228.1 hypothetical protein BST63_02295 [Bradyrhizobium canariense]
MRRVRDVIRMKAAGLPSREIARMRAAPSTVRLTIRRFELSDRVRPFGLRRGPWMPPWFRDDLAHHSGLKSPTRSETISPGIPG